MPTVKKAKATKAPSVKAAAKASTATVAPAAPAQPTLAEQRNAREKLTEAAREHVRTYYAGASLAVHKSRSPKLADCLARIQSPVQQAANGASTRDESLLVRLSAESDKSGTFDPSSPSICADLGVLSRLASLGYIAVRDGAAVITDSGAEFTRNILKRHAAKAA